MYENKSDKQEPKEAPPAHFEDIHKSKKHEGPFEGCSKCQWIYDNFDKFISVVVKIKPMR